MMNEIIGWVILAGSLVYGAVKYIRARRRDPEFRLWKAVLYSLAGMIEEESNDV